MAKSQCVNFFWVDFSAKCVCVCHKFCLLPCQKGRGVVPLSLWLWTFFDSDNIKLRQLLSLSIKFDSDIGCLNPILEGYASLTVALIWHWQYQIKRKIVTVEKVWQWQWLPEPYIRSNFFDCNNVKLSWVQDGNNTHRLRNTEFRQCPCIFSISERCSLNGDIKVWWLFLQCSFQILQEFSIVTL